MQAWASRENKHTKKGKKKAQAPLPPNRCATTTNTHKPHTNQSGGQVLKIAGVLFGKREGHDGGKLIQFAMHVYALPCMLHLCLVAQVLMLQKEEEAEVINKKNEI
jgi:hypothetical protein